MCCTPIFIHTGVVLMRLYMFEKHFENIKEKSLLQHRMRRTATLAARTMSQQNDRGFETAVTESSIGIIKHKRRVPSTDNQQDANETHVDRHSSLQSKNEDEYNFPRHDKDIKFGDLPNPKRHNKDIDPRDMLRSISMMQQNRRPSVDQDGPALVIRGPQEQENEQNENTDIIPPRPPLLTRQSTVMFNTDTERIRTLTETPRRKSRLRSFANIETRLSRANYSSDDDDDEDEDEDMINKVKRVQSNLALPSKDQTGGFKFSKRSNTIEGNTTSHKSSKSFRKRLKETPTFDRMRNRVRKNSRRRSSSFGANSIASNSSLDRNLLSRQMSTNYLSWNPTIGRNSTFYDLSEIQKEELGGVEYRAVKLLAKLLLVYYVGFHVLAVVCFVPWIISKKHYKEYVDSTGVSSVWWGFFTPMSSFNDLGFTLTPDSMSSFNKTAFVLLISGFLIVIGNTGFPCFLRFIIWLLFKITPDLSQLKESLGFLLDHPRRCFTLLFPSNATWWLFFILIILNGIDLILFVILDLHNEVLKPVPVGYRVLDGLFQAISTRTAGFAVVDLSKLHPAIQVSYMLMMYVSVMPLAISIRRTNVYEEQSLGVYQSAEEHIVDSSTQTKKFIASHLRRQLSFDLWYVFLGLFIICLADGGKIKDAGQPNFNVFQVLFEIVSAYGTVGLSLGYQQTNTSFSGQFSVISKLVIIAMMIRGRHRGLPYSLDRAIMLPSKKMKLRDEVQALQAMKRTQTAVTEYETQPTNDEIRTSEEDESKRRKSHSNVINKGARTLLKHCVNALTVGGKGTSLKKYHTMAADPMVIDTETSFNSNANGVNTFDTYNISHQQKQTTLSPIIGSLLPRSPSDIHHLHFLSEAAEGSSSSNDAYVTKDLITPIKERESSRDQNVLDLSDDPKLKDEYSTNVSSINGKGKMI